MDECIRSGVSATEQTLPGRLKLQRRAPMLYRRLMRGCVKITVAVSDVFDNFLLSSLYPGVASPSGPGISAGWKPEAIRKPVDFENLTPEDDTSNNGSIYKGARPVTGVVASRAPRVVGSFDHPLLPMPPVSQFLLGRRYRSLKTIIEEDGCACHGLPLVLCYRS
jgi:hypothetical protein